MRCEDFPTLLGGYLDEELDDDRRREVQEHLATCDGCRRWAVTQDPTVVFALPSRQPEPSRAQVEACTAAVMAQVRQRRLERRLGVRRRPWLAAAAVAVMLAGAATMWRLSSGGPPIPTAPTATAADASQRHVPPPRVEVDMLGEGVRVYQFAEEQEDDTAVYFVVNPALES